jgi:hypothetical protein
MPLRVTDQTPWRSTPRSALGTPALRRIDWELPLSATAGARPPGPRAGRLAARPRLDYFASDDITSERNNNLEHPPQRHVRKKLDPFTRDNRLHIEWIALGCTAESFWTARWRWIIALESPVRFKHELCLARLSPYGPVPP